MKRNGIPKSALTYLIIGLLMTILPLIIGRYFLIPNMLKGFINGLGLALEIIALIKIQRNKRAGKCEASEIG